MAYSEEVRNNVISRVEKGENVKNISDELNISIATIYNWLKKYNKVDTTKVNLVEKTRLKDLINEIKKLTEENKLEMALNLCNTSKGTHSVRIQSQKVKILLLMFEESNNKDLLKEALGICENYKGNKIFDNQKNKIEAPLLKSFNSEIVSENISLVPQIKNLIEERKLEEALNLCNAQGSLDDKIIQAQKVRILLLMFEKNSSKVFLEEALSICERNKGDYNFDVQNSKIKLLLSKHFNEKININNILPVSQIKFLIKEKKFAEALKLCDDPKNLENKNIQAQKIKILLLMFGQSNSKHLLEEALIICKKNKGFEQFDEQSTKINLLLSKYFNKEINLDGLSPVPHISFLIKEKKLWEAVNVCNDPKNLDNKNVQAQKITILLSLFKRNRNKELLEDALSVCEKNKGDERFDKRKGEIEFLLSRYFNIKSNLNNPSSKTQINLTKDKENTTKLTTLLTRLYQSNISKEELKNSEITLWEKHLLLISYYEKNDKKTRVSYIKKIKNQYQDIPEKKKILNLLYERLVSKKQKIFDPTIYSRYLNCTIDQTQINSPIKIEEKIVVKEQHDSTNLNKTINNQVKQKKKPVKTKKIISCTGVTLNRYNQPNNSNTEKNKNNTKTNTTKTNQICIKDLFPKEVFEIGSYLYIQMNKYDNKSDAIKAWDIFDNLINKPSDDKEALTRMISLLKRLEHSDILTTKPNESQIQKRLRK